MSKKFLMVLTITAILLPSVMLAQMVESWTATCVSGCPTQNAPVARAGHTAIWTGTEMIVWGGEDELFILNSGGRYASDAWSATATENAPDARKYHTAVWAGTEMIVWGGDDGTFLLNSGGRYASDAWSATAAENAPDARKYHTAVWTGTEMIVWGGYNSDVSPIKGGPYLNTGGRYNPATDSWTETRGGRWHEWYKWWSRWSNVPSGRYAHTAVWTGTEMIIWGGLTEIGAANTGARYNPAVDMWSPMFAPTELRARYNHTAIWTGAEMIIWGGTNGSVYFNDGWRYNPATNSWTKMSSTTLEGREAHSAVWSDALGEMLVWGGSTGSAYFGTGGRYNPATNSWQTLTLTDAPSARAEHTAVWTGAEMIVWGGRDGSSFFNTGGRWMITEAPPPPPPVYGSTPNIGPTAGYTTLAVTVSESGEFTESARVLLRKGSAYVCTTPISWSEKQLLVRTHPAPAGIYDVVIDLKGDSGRYQYCTDFYYTAQPDDVVISGAFTYTDLAYVSNMISGSISVIDTATRRVYGAISPVGETPMDLAVSKQPTYSGRWVHSLVDTVAEPAIAIYETANLTLEGTFVLPTVDGVTLAPLSMKADEIEPLLFVVSPIRQICEPPPPDVRGVCPPVAGNVMAIGGLAPSAMAVVEGLENIEVHNGTDFNGNGIVDKTEETENPIEQKKVYPIDIAAPIVYVDLPYQQPTVVASTSVTGRTYPQRFAYVTTAAELESHITEVCVEPIDPTTGKGKCFLFVHYTQGPNRVSVIDLNPYRVTWLGERKPPPDDDEDEYPDRCVIIGGIEFCFRHDIMSPSSTRNIEVVPNPWFGKEIAVLGALTDSEQPLDIPEEMGLAVAKTNGEYVYVINRKKGVMHKIDAATRSFVQNGGAPLEIPLGPAPTDVAYGRYQNPNFPYNVNKYLYVSQGGDPSYAETDSNVRVIDTQIPGDGWGFIPDIDLCLNPDDPLTCGKYPTSIAAMSAPSEANNRQDVYTTNFWTDNVGVVDLLTNELADDPPMIDLLPERGPKRVDIQPIHTASGFVLSAWQLIVEAPDEFFMASPSKKEELLNQFWSVLVLYAKGKANVRALVTQIDNIIAKADRWISNPELKARFIELMTAWKASLMMNRR